MQIFMSCRQKKDLKQKKQIQKKKKKKMMMMIDLTVDLASLCANSSKSP
jgi:hypothetical protein